MIEQSNRPLIVGAGPVGLAAALFLACDGVRPRIIDAAPHPSTWSKALAVNPRTLQLLEPTGVTAQMLEAGMRIQGGRFSRGSELLGQFTFDGLEAKYPFLLALSQGATVRLLEAALNRQGIQVEWGVALVHCRNAGDHVLADLKQDDVQPPQTVQFPWLLAADGAHSVVRREMGIDFPGSSFERPWYLADVPLTTPLADDWAHVYFRAGGGFLFMVRVVGDPTPVKASGGASAPLWRLISNEPDPLTHLPAAHTAGPAVWESSFRISHRINQRMRQGQVYFAGDAAHIHSPIGARGMNLGIEDAWVFARLHRFGQLARYDELRHPVDRRVVRRVELVSRLVVGESATSRLLRGTAFPLMIKVPLTRGLFLKTATGLDHPLPAIP